MLLLEEQGILHRDLAARNLLVDVDRQKYAVKVADFGMARVAESYPVPADTPLPVKWCAVEVLQRQRYTTKSDIWAFGVVLWEMFSYGEEPYGSMSNKEAAVWVRNGNRLVFPPRTPPSIVELGNRCWLDDPDLRPTFSEVSLHF